MLKKMVNGVEVECSAEEDAAIRAEWATPQATPTYRELRAPLYPPVKDGLDAIAKGGQALEDWKAECMAVKALVPKT